MNSSAQPASGTQTEQTEFKVQDTRGTKEFTGILLSEVSTETREGPRWLEMDLYRITDGVNTGSYVLHLVGRSVVYHAHRSTCNRGIPRTPRDEDWAADAEPCRVCKPPYWAVTDDATGNPMRDSVTRELVPNTDFVTTEFDLEMDRHTAFLCATAEAVVAQLEESSRHQRSPSKLSAPAQRLLDAAALIDPDIAKAITVVEKI